MTLTAVVAGAVSATAMPAYPGPVQSVQPDGTVVTILLRGDERLNWAETTDGYTLLRDGQGYWTFAEKDSDGIVKASRLRYRNDPLPAQDAGIQPGLRVTRRQSDVQKAAASDLQVDESFPATGNRKLLMLLVNYSDTQPVYSQEDFYDMMNGQGYNGIGSFRDYYLESSYGKLDIVTTVTRWVDLPFPKSYYGADGAIAMIRDALTSIDSEIDLRDFDNDGDGILDGLAVIHQGAGQEYTGSANDIWSHSSAISGMEFDGVQVRRYTIEPELLGTTGRISTIGVVCHEFGHNLGAPDFYDTDYDSSGGNFPGTGVWDLMGSGAWNGNQGDRPAGTNMWQKIQLGWCTPTILTGSTEVSGMSSADKAAVAYRFDTTVPGEYFILENRQKSGQFDSALPGHGLIIYHASETLIRQTVGMNTLNVSYPQAMYTVCAAAGCDPGSYFSSYGDVNSDAAPFPGSLSKTVFGDQSLPSAKSIDGRNSYKALGNITENADGEISFTFTDGGAPEAPVNLTATASRGVVELTWEMPEESEAPLHFSVYRDAVLIATTTDTRYTDTEITTETALDYYVDATYANGLTSPYAITSIRIPANFVSSLTASADEEAGTVTLNWSVGTRLSRNTDLENSEIIDYYTSSIDYVHRFTAEDLSVFKGYKIRKIGFLPYQGPRVLTFTIRVWEADADGSNPVIVSEREIKEFGAMTWNDLLLTAPVEISGQKQLWLGVHCESNENLIQIISDRSGVGAGRGNWIKIGDGGWDVDSKTTDNYYLRFTLAEPELDGPVDMPDTGGTVDPEVDLAFPLGFTVYRDGEFIGSTGNRCFVDHAPLNGTHTYSVSSCYKGDNESVSSVVDVEFKRDSGLDDVDTGRTDGITVSGHGIVLPDYRGTLEVIDLSGRVLVSRKDYNPGDYIVLMPGVYVVRTDGNATKAVIR